MCVACPAKIVSKQGEKAQIVDCFGNERQVNCPLPVQKDDCVLIGMGFAVQKITDKEYEEFADAQRSISML